MGRRHLLRHNKTERVDVRSNWKGQPVMQLSCDLTTGKPLDPCLIQIKRCSLRDTSDELQSLAH